MTKVSNKHVALSSHKRILGVVGGVAEHYSVDPNLLRVLVAILIVSTGIIAGTVIYFITYAIIKSEPK